MNYKRVHFLNGKWSGNTGDRTLHFLMSFFCKNELQETSKVVKRPESERSQSCIYFREPLI